MGNSLNPPSIIFINKGISDGVLSQLIKQLSIDEVQSQKLFNDHMDGYSDGYHDENDYLGDGYISDGLYTKHQKGLGKRILVLIDMFDYTNRDKADLVLCYRRGLVYVEQSKYGPPTKALSLQDVYIRALIS